MIEDCILWDGYTDSQGYPYERSPRKGDQPMHREAWVEHHGPLAPGMQVHHRCRTRECVNIDHLVALTPREHHALHDAERTHCPHGHPYEGENLYVRPDGKGRGCMACRHAANAKKGH